MTVAPPAQLRALLNTWHVPHRTRVPVDELPALAARPDDWHAALPGIPPPTGAQVGELAALRDAMRGQLGTDVPTGLAGWLDRHPVRAVLAAPGPVGHRGTGDPVSAALALLVDAVAAGGWSRLKACPGCRHVFHDHSRNRSRTWCSMSAGAPDGRACGSIAKVRAYRERRRG